MLSRLHRPFHKWLFHHSYEFKWYYLGAFLSLYVLQNLQALIPEKIRLLTEYLGEGRLSEISVWIFLGLAAGILIFRTLSRLLFFYPARIQQKYLRMEILERLESIPTTRYEMKHNQGQIFQILFDDVNNLRAFIGFGLLQIGNLVIAAWVLIPKVSETDAYLWPAFTPLFSSVLVFTIVSFVNRVYFKKILEKKGEVQQYIIESYEAKQTIKNFHKEENFIQGFLKLSAQELSLFFKSSILLAVTGGSYIKLATGASLIWAALIIRARGGTPSDLVFFSGFLYLFIEPVAFMSWVAVVMSQGLAAWKRVKDLNTTLVEENEEEKKLRMLPINRDERRFGLNLDFWGKSQSLELNFGRWTAFIGETGSGKSYLLKKLATTLILQGHKISMVQQEPYLFNDTLAENIFLGVAPTEDQAERAKRFLRIFQLDSLAPSIDEVLNLEVGENGKRLSGGQMKRVALVRSLLSGADTLIWDDPFSSVDIILEKRIIDELKKDVDVKEITFIVSSHRLTTIRLCDDVTYVSLESGIEAKGPVSVALKDKRVAAFFKEQSLGISLA